MKNILEKIIAHKKKEVEDYKKFESIEEMKNRIDYYKTSMTVTKKQFDFKKSLKSNKINVIAEIKKTSPSAGVIIDDYDPFFVAQKYFDSGPPSCFSILTDQKYFGGNFYDITLVKTRFDIPILCKDFFIDPFQVYKAKTASADAILIILAAVSQQTAEELYSVSEDLGMNAIVEVHNTEEATQALKFKKAIIGINNRNLKTLETNIQTTYDLHKILKNHQGPIVCESGIKSEIEVEEIVKKTGINNFLIGESLLKDLNGKSSLLKRIVQIKA